MGRMTDFDNRDRLIQLGIAICTLRKTNGLTQEQLAEKAGISRSLLSAIEAPNMVKSFSLDILFSIARALDVDPAELIRASVIPDDLFNNKFV